MFGWDMKRESMKKNCPLFQKAFEKKLPIWLKRQAGRYLPEYKEVRKALPTFLDLCYTPSKASEVTIQPITRFDFDAAIIFSDILVVPDKLGQKVSFNDQHGIRLDPVRDWYSFINNAQSKDILDHLTPIFEAIHMTRERLDPSKSLIGFCGSPWTIASYMLHGGKSKHFQDHLLHMLNENLDVIKELLNFLALRLGLFLQQQYRSGCDVLQIFDSWAGIVPPEHQEDILIKPLQKIFNVLEKGDQPPVIYYGRGISAIYKNIVNTYPSLHFGFDENTVLTDVVNDIPMDRITQGNVPPQILLKGGQELETSIKTIVASIKTRPHIMNLGHGIIKETPIEHVAQMVKLIKNFRSGL